VIEELDHFRARGHHVLVESLFHSLRSWMRGFYDLLREKLFSILMLLTWRSTFITPLMIWSMNLNIQTDSALQC
jgi:hypothetical protein